MNTYIFASVRGEDFVAMGNNAEEAYKNLCKVHKDTGSLWRLHDRYRNKIAVEEHGFSYLPLDPNHKFLPNIAYKIKL